MPRSTDSQLDRLDNPSSDLDLAPPERPSSRQKVFFDSPGLLEQSQHWGGLVIWTIAAGTTASLFWAFLGRVDQTVLASGTLQPVSGKVTVNSPSGGIVRELFVQDGDLVTQ
jgi:HlyD family secretion protein